VTLLAFAAVVRRAAAAPLLLGAGRATVDRYFTPTGPAAANPPHPAAAFDSWDRRIDGRVPYRRYIYIGADSTGATGNFVPVLTREPGQTLRFAPVPFMAVL